jgi:hypothetical protein
VLLGLEAFTVAGLVLGFCLWMGLIVGVRRWGPSNGERGEESQEPDSAAVDIESSC